MEKKTRCLVTNSDSRVDLRYTGDERFNTREVYCGNNYRQEIGTIGNTVAENLNRKSTVSRLARKEAIPMTTGIIG